MDLVVAAADRLLDETGCDEVSLLSLSSCDYGGVADALTRIRELRPGLRVSLPSLRIDSAAESLAGFAADQRGSLTLAPEAGTQVLRDAINKGVDEAQFDEAVRATFEGGFTGLKLYFMIGLPGETDEDVLGIARMAGTAARLAKEIGRGRARLSVSVSSYVPKAHTPFELEPFAGADTLRRRQQLVRAAVPRGVRVAFHDVAASVVEATLARGGPGTDRLVEEAWRCGARFDGWSEHFDMRRWEDAAAATGIALGRGHGGERRLAGRRGRAPGRGLLRRRARAQPRRRAHRGLPRRRLRRLRRLRRGDRHGAARMTWWLITFARRGPARYLSHLDTSRVVQRTFARAGVPIALSQGMRPKPRISLPLPLPVGAAGASELAVVEVPEGVAATTDVLSALREASPPGVEPLSIVDAGERHPRPQASAAEYACVLDGDAGAIAAAVERYNDTEHAIRERVSPKGTRRLDLKDYAGDVVATPVEGGARVGFTIRRRSDGAARPQELIDLIAEWAEVEPAMRGLERLAIVWDHGLPSPQAGQRKELST